MYLGTLYRFDHGSLVDLCRHGSLLRLVLQLLQARGNARPGCGLVAITGLVGPGADILLQLALQIEHILLAHLRKINKKVRK